MRSWCVLVTCLLACVCVVEVDAQLSVCLANCAQYTIRCSTALCREDQTKCEAICNSQPHMDYSAGADASYTLQHGGNTQQVYQAELRDAAREDAAPAPASDNDNVVVCENGDDGSGAAPAADPFGLGSFIEGSVTPKKKYKTGAFCHLVSRAAAAAAGVKLPGVNAPAHDLTKPLKVFQSPLLAKLNSHLLATRHAAVTHALKSATAKSPKSSNTQSVKPIKAKGTKSTKPAAASLTPKLF